MKKDNKNKIDFVLPWVDSSDTKWQEDRAKYEINHNTEDNNTQTRFRDMHTLRYVLRSIEQYCPWYHKIYLITTGHTPEWLNVNHPKIDLITHRQLFIDKDALPVFNSNAIEMNLVNIANLSEKFVYLNDDMMVWQPLGIERFFKNDRPLDFFFHAWLPRNWFYERIKGKDTWIDALNNNIRLINNSSFPHTMSTQHYYHHSYPIKQKISNFLQKTIYKKLFWIHHWHHPQPYLKSTIAAVYSTYAKEMLDTTSHKFRSSKDITPYLYRYWHLITGNFEPYFHNDGFVAKISSLDYLGNAIEKIEDTPSINFVCFNDQAQDISDEEFDTLTIELENYLESKFPNKACFEICT